ncbi:MAG: tyrosine-type recombinase/integrase [Bacteroidota bacterium]|nr:tyrosine-type recombinase/integrase [Bacteroidota bacterium]MDP4192326.1 tyrosine-type recombinase/integrase [Bacteroidota bacterium]MDP4195593.1 tyrosine-type recombinase/integrase [Bacteroidota bacterium]
MLLQNVINDFLDDLYKVKRSSKNTLKSYKKDLEQFADFCTEKKKIDIKEISEKLIRSFAIKQSQNDSRSSTISRKLSAIRSLFAYAVFTGIIESNPAHDISNPKLTRRLPEVVPFDALEEISEDLSDSNQLLYRAIFEILYCCALRVSELCALNYKDIDSDNYTIRVFGKGSKVRIVPIGKTSLNILKQYLDSRGKLEYNSPVFVTQKGRRIYPRLVYRIVNEYLSRKTDLKKKSPHVLRHTAATHMLDKGADLLAVKEILGHESLSTTQIYTHVSVERLKQIHKLAHPKSKKEQL